MPGTYRADENVLPNAGRRYVSRNPMPVIQPSPGAQQRVHEKRFSHTLQQPASKKRDRNSGSQAVWHFLYYCPSKLLLLLQRAAWFIARFKTTQFFGFFRCFTSGVNERHVASKNDCTLLVLILVFVIEEVRNTYPSPYNSCSSSTNITVVVYSVIW